MIEAASLAASGGNVRLAMIIAQVKMPPGILQGFVLSLESCQSCGRRDHSDTRFAFEAVNTYLEGPNHLSKQIRSIIIILAHIL